MQTDEIARKAMQKCTPPNPYQLAKTTGVKWETAKDWITGKRTPNGAHLMKLIQLAGKTLAGAATISAALLLSGGVSEAQAAQAAQAGNSPTLYIMSNRMETAKTAW